MPGAFHAAIENSSPIASLLALAPLRGWTFRLFFLSSALVSSPSARRAPSPVCGAPAAAAAFPALLAPRSCPALYPFARRHLRSAPAKPGAGGASPGAAVWAPAPPISGVLSGAPVRVPVAGGRAQDSAALEAPGDDRALCVDVCVVVGQAVPSAARGHAGPAPASG